MKNRRFTVYADLNCPFCFVLHERLLELDRMAQVDWCCVDHTPLTKYDTSDLHAHAELTQEVTRVREVAPEVNIVIPPGRPHSGLATEYVAEAIKQDAVKGAHFRTLVYRSLWLDGQNFEDRDLLDELARQAGLDKIEPTHSTKEKVSRWQTEWEQGDFSRNIPSLVTPDGNKLLGLPSAELINMFLRGDELDFEEGAFCYLKPKEKVLIAAADDQSMDIIANALITDYQIEVAQYGSAVYESCLSEFPPDLVIMDVKLAEPDGYETCVMIKDNERSQSIPVIMFSDQKNVKQEVKAFDNGAADFIVVPLSDEVLRARVRVLLRLKRTTDLLEQFSRLDSLTEIPNRREFDRVFEREWLRAKRTKHPISIILIDVDYFKLYNDNYGHMEGDQCLKKVAQILEKSVRRPPDVVARYGGEEFVVILPGTDKDGAMQVANKIRDNLHKKNIPHAHSKIADRVTFSQGISTIVPVQPLQPKNLIDAADVALYAAKNAGRNRVMFNKLQQD